MAKPGTIDGARATGTSYEAPEEIVAPKVIPEEDYDVCSDPKTDYDTLLRLCNGLADDGDRIEETQEPEYGAIITLDSLRDVNWQDAINLIPQDTYVFGSSHNEKEKLQIESELTAMLTDVKTSFNSILRDDTDQFENLKYVAMPVLTESRFNPGWYDNNKEAIDSFQINPKDVKSMTVVELGTATRTVRFYLITDQKNKTSNWMQVENIGEYDSLAQNPDRLHIWIADTETKTLQSGVLNIAKQYKYPGTYTFYSTKSDKNSVETLVESLGLETARNTTSFSSSNERIRIKPIEVSPPPAAEEPPPPPAAEEVPPPPVAEEVPPPPVAEEVPPPPDAEEPPPPPAAEEPPPPVEEARQPREVDPDKQLHWGGIPARAGIIIGATGGYKTYSAVDDYSPTLTSPVAGLSFQLFSDLTYASNNNGFGWFMRGALNLDGIYAHPQQDFSWAALSDNSSAQHPGFRTIDTSIGASVYPFAFGGEMGQSRWALMLGYGFGLNINSDLPGGVVLTGSSNQPTNVVTEEGKAQGSGSLSHGPEVGIELNHFYLAGSCLSETGRGVRGTQQNYPDDINGVDYKSSWLGFADCRGTIGLRSYFK